MPLSAADRMKLVLAADRSRLESAIYAVRAEAAVLRQALRQLDLRFEAPPTGTRAKPPASAGA